MKLQKSTCFALFAVIELAAEPQRQLAAAEIANKYGISLHHLAKVLHDLNRAGIVVAVRGAGGGYRFAANPKRLTLMDVIELFEPVKSDTSNDGDAIHGTDVEYALGEILREIDEHAVATFRSVTISTMLKLVRKRSTGAARDCAGRRKPAQPG